jgi:hypothetical protein
LHSGKLLFVGISVHCATRQKSSLESIVHSYLLIGSHLIGLLCVVTELFPSSTDMQSSHVLLGWEIGSKGLTEWVALALYSKMEGHRQTCVSDVLW